MSRPSLHCLTPAERDVALLIGEGLPPEMIARRRRSAVSTVRVQLKAIYKKLGVHRQNELALLMARTGAGRERHPALGNRLS